MKVVFISPCFNASDNLKNLIDSVTCQTDNRWEHIFIDDISADDTCKRFNELVSDNDKFKLIKNSEKKIGTIEKKIFESGKLIIKNESKPCKPVLFNQIDSFNVILTMYEGKYHQIKKMFSACGNQVIELSRIQLGSLTIENLKLGEWKELTKKDVGLLFEN